MSSVRVTREAPRPSPLPIKEVIITLTEHEAEVLGLVLGKVGGPSKGPRGIVDSLLRSLSEAGVEVSKYWYKPNASGTVVLNSTLEV